MLPDPLLIAVAVGLVLLNAFFTAAELSMARVRNTRMEELTQEGDWRAQAVRGHQDRLQYFLSATQLGITLASLGLGWVGEPAFAHLLAPTFVTLGITSDVVVHNAAAAVAFLFITFLHIVVGELVPKAYAIRATEKVALWTALPMRGFQVAVKPALWFLDQTASRILRWLHVDIRSTTDAHSEEELRMLLAESHRVGTLSGEKRELLENIIDYTERTARHAMIPRGDVVYLSLARPLEDNVKIIAQTTHTRFPLATIDIDHVAGMIHVKDLFLRRDQLKSSEDLVDIKREILFVPESRPLDALLREFQQNRTHMAIVVDEYGGTAGMITLEDVIEEIVGEIQDEFDRESPKVVETPDGLVFDGLSLVDDVWEKLGIEVEGTHEVSTLGGFVTEQLGRIPRLGDRTAVDGYELRVLEMKGRRVSKVLAARRGEPKPAEVPSG
ncbi:MAG TPA: hemolysin family protein [Candidatus Eisenbacteria bacterium]|nr:hemolysin family protein [Candidatus Eisenbacteria bacterium]